MKNSLSDLNNYLFGQLERLDDESLSEEQLDQEIKRSKATREIAQMIIENAKVQLEAVELAAEYSANIGADRAGKVAVALLGDGGGK